MHAVIGLESMSQEEADRFLEDATHSFAAELADEQMPFEAALEQARAILEGELSHGSQTPLHSFLWVLDDGRRVGRLWVGPLTNHPDGLHIWEFRVDAEHRGRGVGRRAMRAVIDEGRRRRVSRLSLGVDADNGVARRLYERAGFAVTAEAGGRLQMVLWLSDQAQVVHERGA